jgi:hypothetical protein
MNLFSVFQEAVNKKVGNETTKMSENDIKKTLDGKLPKWIRELTSAQQKKYALLLRRFTMDKSSGVKKPELFAGGYRIPTVLKRDHIEAGIKKGLSMDKIIETHPTTYDRFLKPKLGKDKVKTSKTLKTGEKKEKPIIAKLAKIMKRDLTEKEKETAIWLSEKPTPGYRWSLEELEGLFDNKEFQKDIKAFEPWNADAFSKMVMKTEARVTGDFFNVKKKDDKGKPLPKAEIDAQERQVKKNTMTMAMAIRKADNLEFVDFLKKNKSLFTAKKSNEDMDTYLKKLFDSVKKFAEKEKNQVIDFLMDSYLSSLKKKHYTDISEDVASINDLKDVLDKGVESIILSADMKNIRAEEEKESKNKLFGDALKKAIDEEQTRVTALTKDLSKLTKDDAIEIPSWNGQMDINKYIKGLFTKFNVTPEISRLFSREGRMQISTISTGTDEFKKPTHPLTSLHHLGEYLKLHYASKFEDYKKKLKDEDAPSKFSGSIQKYIEKYAKGDLPKLK